MSCQYPYYVKLRGDREVPVACGRCHECRKDIINQWVFRILKEEERSTSSYFITLTYDTDNVPMCSSGMTLDKKDFQLFIKNLRRSKKEKGSKIKYFACGEYGEDNMRPHYHAIIFNLNDIESVANHWKKGNIHFGSVSSSSIAYTAKYINKSGSVPVYSGDKRVPEFRLMSKRLGDNYVTEARKKWHKKDLSRQYCTLNGHKIPLPRYYRKKIYPTNVLEKYKIHQAKIDWDAPNVSEQIAQHIAAVDHINELNKEKIDQYFAYRGKMLPLIKLAMQEAEEKLFKNFLDTYRPDKNGELSMDYETWKESINQAKLKKDEKERRQSKRKGY